MTASVASIPNIGADMKAGKSEVTFGLGSLVNVQSRTWPGINKPGGVGRVVAVNTENGSIDVKYVLGGVEKGVEFEFVELHKFVGEEEATKAGNTGRARRRQESVQTKSDKERALKDASNISNEIKKNNTKKANTSKATSKRKAQGSVNAAAKSDKKAKVQASKTMTKKAKKDANKNTDSKNKKTSNKKSKPTANKYASDVKKCSSTSSSPSSRWLNPTLVLQNVYKGMKQRGASFVKEIVGKTSSAPSSPESTSSLVIRMETGRESEFDSTFSTIMRQKMLDAIEFDDLMKEMNARENHKPFTELEMKQHLERLDKNNKIMVSTDSGSIYML